MISVYFIRKSKKHLHHPRNFVCICHVIMTWHNCNLVPCANKAQYLFAVGRVQAVDTGNCKCAKVTVWITVFSGMYPPLYSRKLSNSRALLKVVKLIQETDILFKIKFCSKGSTICQCNFACSFLLWSGGAPRLSHVTGRFVSRVQTADNLDCVIKSQWLLSTMYQLFLLGGLITGKKVI